MAKKMKKLVLTLALVSGFTFLSASPSDASSREIDPGPIVKPMSVGGYTLDH